MRPNHHQFIAFAYVVREGSFSAAARALGVSQSTVTQHVSNLEKQVGSLLLLRGRDGVSLTPTGKDFYNLADRLTALDTEIGERIQDFSFLEKGTLKVIANAPQPALRIIAHFNKMFPSVHIEFRLVDWTSATTMIRERAADIGLITNAPEQQDWDRLLLHDTRYVAYCRRDSALAKRRSIKLRDLCPQTVILPEEGSLTQKVVTERLRSLGVRFDKLVTMTTFPVMCEAVRQGIGVAIFLRESSLAQDDLVEVELSDFTQIYKTWLVSSKDRSRLRLVSEFKNSALAVA